MINDVVVVDALHVEATVSVHVRYPKQLEKGWSIWPRNTLPSCTMLKVVFEIIAGTFNSPGLVELRWIEDVIFAASRQ